jgi:hypothetical protein
MFIVVVYFVIDSVRKLLDTPSYYPGFRLWLRKITKTLMIACTPAELCISYIEARNIHSKTTFSTQRLECQLQEYNSIEVDSDE